MTAPPSPLDRRALLGALCWTAAVAYFAAQPLVAAGWTSPYDLADNSISDLGVTSCGSHSQLDGAVIHACSPRHALMNAIFVLTGLLTVAGALLTRGAWPRRRRLASAGLALVALAGLGAVLVGLAPANVAYPVHAAGAVLRVPGALGPLLLGLAIRDTDRGLAAFSMGCGVIGPLACALYLGQVDTGIGSGLTERLAFETLTVWLVVAGTVLLWRTVAALRGTAR